MPGSPHHDSVTDVWRPRNRRRSSAITSQPGRPRQTPGTGSTISMSGAEPSARTRSFADAQRCLPYADDSCAVTPMSTESFAFPGTQPVGSNSTGNVQQQTTAHLRTSTLGTIHPQRSRHGSTLSVTSNPPARMSLVPSYSASQFSVGSNAEQAYGKLGFSTTAQRLRPRRRSTVSSLAQLSYSLYSQLF